MAEADAIRLMLRGELDIASARHFDEVAANAREPGGRHIVVDLRSLSFIDSSGMRALLRLHRSEGARLTIIPGPPVVQRVFELAGLTEALPFRRPT